MSTQLHGHTTPETAYVVDDYPYGFRLRCKIRYWVETKPGFGQRFVSQTTNPKRGEVWNKPKPGIYSPIVVLLRDDSTGYISCDALSPYDPERIEEFAAKYDLTKDPHHIKMVDGIRAALKLYPQLTPKEPT